MLKNSLLPALNPITLVAVVVAISVAAYAINLLVVGETWTIVPETINGVSSNELDITTVRVPYPPAFIPLIAATVLLIGFLGQRPGLAWLGLAALLVFSLLFVFSGGGILLPVCALLFVLMLRMKMNAAKQPQPSLSI